MAFKHIIFDCDGVLVDSEIIAAETMVPVLNTFGHGTTLKHYLANYTGQTFKGIFKQFEIDDRVDIDMLIKNVEEKVYENIRPIVGVPELVKSLSLPTSVVSNSGPSQIDHAVRTIGLKEVFVDEFSASAVDNPKPAPDVYLHALQQLALQVEDCIVVEDSISGCTAAKAAGLYVIGFCGGSHIIEDHAINLTQVGADSIAQDSKELKALLLDLVR